jgi:hypothetical protein
MLNFVAVVSPENIHQEGWPKMNQGGEDFFHIDNSFRLVDVKWSATYPLVN